MVIHKPRFMKCSICHERGILLCCPLLEPCVLGFVSPEFGGDAGREEDLCCPAAAFGVLADGCEFGADVEGGAVWDYGAEVVEMGDYGFVGEECTINSQLC